MFGGKGVPERKTDTLMKNNLAAKVIVMGDLNRNPIDSLITKTLEAKTEKNEADARTLFNPLAAIYKSGRGSVEYLDKWDLFDQIIISGSFLGKASHLHFERATIFKKGLYGRP